MQAKTILSAKYSTFKLRARFFYERRVKVAHILVKTLKRDDSPETYNFRNLKVKTKESVFFPSKDSIRTIVFYQRTDILNNNGNQ